MARGNVSGDNEVDRGDCLTITVDKCSMSSNTPALCLMDGKYLGCCGEIDNVDNFRALSLSFGADAVFFLQLRGEDMCNGAPGTKAAANGDIDEVLRFLFMRLIIL